MCVLCLYVCATSAATMAPGGRTGEWAAQVEVQGGEALCNSKDATAKKNGVLCPGVLGLGVLGSWGLGDWGPGAMGAKGQLFESQRPTFWRGVGGGSPHPHLQPWGVWGERRVPPQKGFLELFAIAASGTLI